MTGRRRLGWKDATQHALYDDGGFYRRGLGPISHFRTSVHGSPLLAEAVLALARSAGQNTVVDVGSGRGELLCALHVLDPQLHLVAVELADRPVELPGAIDWSPELPSGVDGLLIANEWLDNVPVDVAQVAADGWRLVLVDPADGSECLGGLVAGNDLAWLDQWWPMGEVGDRAEIGWPRDVAWAAAVAALSHGLAVAVDYHHERADRPRSGSLAGYRSGVRVDPLPDGTCDITSHVALDACAAAGVAAGADTSELTDQRATLNRLLGEAPATSYALARRDPAGYLAALARASHLAELTGRGGLGDFGWLVQTVRLAARE